MEKAKYLIIGNGISALSAAKEIKQNDIDSNITMISNEEYPTYYRIKLTEALGKDMEEKDFIINDMSWYNERNINLILRKIVEKIHIDESSVTLDDGTKIKYDKLLIASGSSPFIPPINGKYKQGVFALRGLKDLELIRNNLKKGDKVTIIGGGLLGLEAAWALKSIGKTVSVIEFSPYLLPRQLDKELGEKLAKKLKENGINIYLDSTVEKIEGNDEATGIVIDSGEEIKSNTILVSTGIRPNIDLVRQTNISINKGILVDETLKTNIDNIYAAGDVVEYNNKIVGLWTTSMEQGKIAGANMSGKKMEYIEPKPFSSLRIGDIKLFSAGDILDYDQIYEYKDGKDIHHKIFVKDGSIHGAILFGDIKEMGKIKSMVFSKVDIEVYLKEGTNFQLVK